MAMVKTSNRIIDINGRVGGNIYRSDQCGIHVQAAPRKILKPPTMAAKIRRRAWQILIHRYVKKMSREQMTAWQQYANQRPRKNRKGETYTLTWWQQFISTNLNRQIAGKTIYFWPPGYAPFPP